MDRRQFLAAGAAGLTLPAFAFEDARPKRVGLIGCGWYGKVDLLRLLQVAPVEVVSLCDTDALMLKEAGDIVASRQQSRKVPRLYGDYREMLAEKDLDIVIVGTPDHWHALPMIEAVKAGADVYVQKPISVDVVEGQAMLAAARKYKKVVQVGTQRRSTPHLIEAIERVIKGGLLGDVRHAEVYCYYHMRPTGNPADTAPPDHLDYNAWTGPAPMRPYNPLVHPRSWRAFNEYGNGIMGDMCIHMLDTVRWMMGWGWPKRISSSGGIYVQKDAKANIPDTQSAVFDYGDRTVVWQHRTWGNPVDPRYPWGATLYGDKGKLRVSVARYDFEPYGNGNPISVEARASDYGKYPEDETEKDIEPLTAEAVRGHMRDFLKAVAERGRPVADIEEGHISTASCILANISMQLGRTLTWDAEAGKVAGDDEANALLAREYRAPYRHPDPATV